MSRPRVISLLLMLMCSGVARAQPVQGDVRSVGFRASEAVKFAARAGQWMPILVELTVPGSEHLQVDLRCECVDLDGDRVAFTQGPVGLTAGAGLQRIWCYAVTLGYDPLKVDVISADGVLITSLPVPAFDILGNDDMLILDISGERSIAALRRLRSGDDADDGFGFGSREYYRPVRVATMPPHELPDRWWGLEAVDVVVWDRPDPQKLSAHQLEALVQWVRNGGQLVVGIGLSWGRIQDSPELAEIIPLRGEGTTITVATLPKFIERLAPAGEFEAPVAVTTARAAEGAQRTFWDERPGGRLSLITMQMVGSGRVIATAASLADLTSVPVRREFWSELFDLNRHTEEFLKAEADLRFALSRGRKGLFAGVAKPVEFSGRAGLLVLAGMLFISIYIGLATAASWWWLKRRRLTQLSWTVFAAFALLASVLSVGIVGMSRGVFGKVHSTSLVDLEAGSSEARALCLFGYNSPRRQRIDLSLPTVLDSGELSIEGNYLRAMAHGGLGRPTYYATTERYTARPAKSALLGTPMRATLKQFEGFWQGRIRGGVRGRLIADRGTGQILPESWIANDLDADIGDGYVLYIDPRAADVLGLGEPYRAAGLSQARPGGFKGNLNVPPAVNILALRLPSIAAHSEVRNLGSTEYATHGRDLTRWAAQAQPDPKRRPELTTLWDAQQHWVGNYRGVLGFGTDSLNATDEALLLASTRAFYLHSSEQDFATPKTPVTTAGLVDRDVSHWLIRGQAVLLLIADQPGPATLYGNGRPMETQEGRSLYRVRVPIETVRSGSGGTTP
ncbi:MAG: hypothetical protein KKB50_05140 [Planctomycetes bacterium]|nr:hypothetical protein [Planctomycetota bacterium]